MRKTTISGFLSTAVVCMLFWMLLTGQITAIFQGAMSLQVMIAGVIVSLLVSLFSSRFFIHEKAFHLLVKLPQLLYYCIIVFPVELIKANFDVACRALNPKLPVNPGIVKVPVEVESEYGMSMLANSITLTPGTITMDIADDEEGKTWYYIHWIDVASEDPEEAGNQIKGRLEKGVRKVWR